MIGTNVCPPPRRVLRVIARPDPSGRSAEEVGVARRNDYTGDQCDRGHPMYFRVVTVGSGSESRRGPSCWFDDCPVHRAWQEAAGRRNARA